MTTPDLLRREAAPASALRGAADWLCLAAAPTFAGMAVLTLAGADGPAVAMCGAMPAASPLSGMTAMYLLMSLFHAAPWLRLAASLRGPKLFSRAATP